MASHRCPSCGTYLFRSGKLQNTPLGNWVCSYERCRFPWNSEKAPLTEEQRQRKVIHDLQFKVDTLELNADLRRLHARKLELRLDDLISRLHKV